MLHRIETEQWLPVDRKVLWDFMSNPENLAVITPSYMNFRILSQLGPSMYPGQIIEYFVSPLAGFSLGWVTEITHVKEGEYFVDEQRSGPYAFWHHQHWLSDHNQGTAMKDMVHYKVPFGIAGRILNHIYIRKKLEQIFAYRHQKLQELFGS